jgi:Holliday junction resolvasome RuvABC endonuclease subunit
MVIDIKLLEKVTGYKIKKNFESIGVDTATRTGIAIVTTGEKVVNIDYQFLEYDKINKKERYKHMVRSFEDIIIDENLAVVEDVFVGLNRKGSVELARYGAFVISECIKKEIPFEIISAVSARARLKINTRQYGKGKSKLAVSHWLKSSLGIEFRR